MEEKDPQDTAVLSDDMAEPAVTQREVKVKSVYEGLIELAKTHGKVYRTNGKRADMLKFDLTAHSVFVGNTFIISNGEVKMPVLETASARIDIKGLPWLTVEEKDISPEELFKNHWLSRPNGAEKYMSSNFKAKDIDELTDVEMMKGEPRGEARVRLEAWVLCAALDGTLESYVTNSKTWVEGSWWWSPTGTKDSEPQLVIKTEWWKRECGINWVLENRPDGKTVVKTQDGCEVAVIAPGADVMTARAIQMVPKIIRTAKSLSRNAFALQSRAKCFDIDPIICELNRTMDYVETGVSR